MVCPRPATSGKLQSQSPRARELSAPEVDDSDVIEAVEPVALAAEDVVEAVEPVEPVEAVPAVEAVEAVEREQPVEPAHVVAAPAPAAVLRVPEPSISDYELDSIRKSSPPVAARRKELRTFVASAVGVAWFICLFAIGQTALRSLIASLAH